MATEAEKFIAAKPKAEVLSEFLDWLDGEGIALAESVPKYAYHSATHAPISESRESLLCRFFGIDRDELERERRAILEEMRRKP